MAEEFATFCVDAPLPTRDALLTGRAVVCARSPSATSAIPPWRGSTCGQSAFCVVPLLSGVRPVGTLGLGWDEPAELTDDLLALCDAVAVVCANALHRSLAAGEEAAARRRSDTALARLRALQDVAADLAHTVDLPHAVSIVLERVVATLGAEAASFNLLDERAGTCTQVATIGLEGSAVSTWDSWRIRDSSLAQELLRTGLPILVSDAAATRRARFPDLGDDGIEQEAWATLLLTSGETPLGMMAFGWREPRTFEPRRRRPAPVPRRPSRRGRRPREPADRQRGAARRAHPGRGDAAAVAAPRAAAYVARGHDRRRPRAGRGRHRGVR